MSQLASKEDKIRQLENELSNSKITSSFGSNCVSIARTELQLSQLYTQTGNPGRADELMTDALKTLKDPLCVKTRQTDQMIRSIEYYKNNPGSMRTQPVPTIYRYLSLIVLIAGYGVLYLWYGASKPSYNYFLFGVLGVFVLSLVINFLIRSRFTRKNTV